MRVLVTGSNGFIGKYLCERLIKEHEVIGIGTAKVSSSQVTEYYQISIDSPDFLYFLANKISDCDVIVHLAAYIDMSHFDKNLITTNIIGTSQIVELAKILACKQIIHLSSIPVIGVPKEIPISENHPENPQTLYHITKLAAEHIINLGSNFSINTVNLRISSPIGIGMKDNTILSVFLNNCRKNTPIYIYGKGKRRQNYIDIRDIVQAIISSIENNVSGIFNIAAESTISNIELAQLCVELSNSSSEIRFSKSHDPEENNRWEISIKKAYEEFGFKPKYNISDSITSILNRRNGDL